VVVGCDVWPTTSQIQPAGLQFLPNRGLDEVSEIRETGVGGLV
jgi:hypothetical protein